MDNERYPGERRGLGLFLEELAPVVERELGTDSLLHHAIRRALRWSSLKNLRHARRLFNSLPRADRHRLSAGMVAAPEAKPGRDALLRDYREREPQPFVCIEADPPDGGPRRKHVELRHELIDGASVTVLVRPGSLPSAAAASLREIADMIEHDRRILSTRYWRRTRMRRFTGIDSADFA